MSRSNSSLITITKIAATTALAVLLMALPLGLGCNAAIHGNPFIDDPVDLAVPPPAPDDGLGPHCVNLKCRIPDCRGMSESTTTLSGVVNIPAGNLPLYNATVYIPNRPVAPIVSGASCDRCDEVFSGEPVAMTQTDVSGKFTLTGIPAGADIPLVIRLGKWRRQITLPAIQACKSNTVTAEQTRLPRNRSEGDIPKVAVVTGAFDATECLLRKLGIDDSEFTPEADGGRVNLFTGHGGTNAFKPGFNNGAPFTVASDAAGMPSGWWSSLDNLKQYDMVVLSCEGTQYPDEKSDKALAAMEGYINQGGRVFASHWHNVWMDKGSKAMQSIAKFKNNSTYTNTVVNINLLTPSGEISEKGNALADWMVAAGASPSPPGRGRFSVFQGRSTVTTNSLNTALAQRFVTYQPDPRVATFVEQYFSFFAPIEAPAKLQCGRMVFTDMHVSGSDANHPDPNLDLSAPAKPFPTGCVTTSLSAQEKALVFLLFDLSNCIQPEIG